MHLGDALARLGPQRLARAEEAHRFQDGILFPAAAEVGGNIIEFLHVAPAENPVQPQRGKPLANVDPHVGVGIGPGGVVERDVRIGDSPTLLPARRVGV